MATVQLSDKMLAGMGMAKVIKREKPARVNAIDISADGEHVIVSNDDESLNLFVLNDEKTMERKHVWSKKYGCELARFTHHPSAVIFASKNGWDESIRYLSLHDNRYLRYFKGHREAVCSIAMAPKDDQFLSASLDDTVRLWALNSHQCVGLLRTRTNARPQVAYDPQGLVFAVAAAGAVRLFDSRSFENGPFATFHVPLNLTGTSSTVTETTFSAVHFSPDGKFLLLPCADQAAVLLLDAFSGERLQCFSSHVNDSGLPLDARFTPDGAYVLGGSEDGTVRVWRRSDATEVASLAGHSGPVRSLAVNPRYAMFASACSSLAFWLPSEDPMQM